MNTDKFQAEGDGFDLLGLKAQFRFKTETSIGFDIGCCPVEGKGLNVAGCLQVHHPCEGRVKLMIFVALSDQHRDFKVLTKRDLDKLKTIPSKLMDELAIPHDETYEIHVRYHAAGDASVYDTNRKDILYESR
jgi:hypothetical protein